jgi:DNA helicase-2/ATP-dependent DNA helicase PcrA
MAEVTETRQWSLQQNGIFSFFAKKPIHADIVEMAKKGTFPTKYDGSLAVRARAGTGKTTTIIEAINYAPEAKILLAAFNKKIAEELALKLKNPKAEAKTLHSLGFSYVRRNWDKVRVDNDRSERLVRTLDPSMPDVMANMVKKLAACGKNSAPFPKQSVMEDLAYTFDLIPDEQWDDDGWSVPRIAHLAMQLMDLAAKPDGTVDFDDMVFVPVRNKWVRPWYDMVVIDEAQDMNPTQLLLAQGACKKTGRVIVVGDDRQAIYGFRGADSYSIDRLKNELHATELGLTITYRCPKNVVASVQHLVPDYVAAPTAPEGIYGSASYEQMIEKADVSDFVLSRKNAPLVAVCLRFLRKGKRCMIEGKDVGKNLVAIVRKLKAKSIPDFMEKLTAWEDKQVERLHAVKKKSAEAKIEQVHDQAETLRELATDMAGIPELEARINTLFQETPAGKRDFIRCSTVHKAKGLETERVWGLVETLYPGRGRIGMDKNSIEEQNIEYVMKTRAKNEFYAVTGIG